MKLFGLFGLGVIALLSLIFLIYLVRLIRKVFKNPEKIPFMKNFQKAERDFEKALYVVIWLGLGYVVFQILMFFGLLLVGGCVSFLVFFFK